MRTRALPVVCVLAAFALGWHWGTQPRTVKPRHAASALLASNSLPPIPARIHARVETAALQTTARPTLQQRLADLCGSPLRRHFRLMRDFVYSLDPADFPAAMSALEKISGAEDKSALRAQLLSKWAEEDPAAAMAHAEKVPGFGQRTEAVLAVVRGWAEEDPKAAAEWIQQLPNGQLRNQCIYSINLALAQKAPEDALVLLESTGHPMWAAASELFGAWAAKDPQGAIAKAMTLPDGRVREQALNGIAGEWAHQDPQAALAWAKTLPGRERDGLTAEILSRWAGADPRSAAAIALEMPAGQARNVAVARIAQTWASSDMNAALAW